MTQELAKQETPSLFNFFDKEQFEVMQRICKMFSSSELVPEMYRANEKNSTEKAMANCMIAIEVSQRIGASPLLVMQNLIIIYGRPSWSSKFLISTVNTCGRFNALQYKFENLGKLGKIPYIEYEWNGKSKAPVKKEFDGTLIDNIQCIAYTTSKGSTNILESSPISVKLAIQEGWYTKSGSKWPNMSQQMLMYRSASFWTNAYAPELSMGMKTEEEVRDTIDLSPSEYKDVTEEIKDKANKETLTPKSCEVKNEDKPTKDVIKETPKEAKKEEIKKEPEKIQKPSGEQPPPVTPNQKEPEQAPPPPEAPANRGLFNEQRGF